MSLNADESIQRLATTENLLHARHRRLLMCIAFPLFVIVLTLALHQYASQRESVISELQHSSATLGIALDGVTQVTTDHIKQIQSAFERCLTYPAATPNRLQRFQTPVNNSPAAPVAMDQVPSKQRHLTGQLIQLDAPNQAHNTRLQQCVLELFGVIQLNHQSNTYFQWSYFLAANEDLAGIYPWISSYDLSQGLGFASVAEAIESWFEYDVYKGIKPVKNPDKTLHWTAPYVDAVGAGTMISLGAPRIPGRAVYGWRRH